MENKAIIESIKKDLYNRIRQNLPKFMDASIKVNDMGFDDNLEVGCADAKVFTYCRN